jgi:hypothetical protein
MMLQFRPDRRKKARHLASGAEAPRLLSCALLRPLRYVEVLKLHEHNKFSAPCQSLSTLLPCPFECLLAV